MQKPRIRKELLIKDGELPVTIQKVDVDSLLAFVAFPWCLDIVRTRKRCVMIRYGTLIQEKKVNSRSEVSSGRRYLRLS